MDNAENTRKNGLDRRQVLGLGAAALAIAAIASIPFRVNPFRRTPKVDGIPGAGSIFEPRPGAVDEFLRNHGK